MAHAYCCKWRLKANVSKSAVVVFARELELVEGSWNWGEQLSQDYQSILLILLQMVHGTSM